MEGAALRLTGLGMRMHRRSDGFWSTDMLKTMCNLMQTSPEILVDAGSPVRARAVSSGVEVAGGGCTGEGAAW